MQRTFAANDIEIREVSPTPVAIMKHRGDPARIGDTIKRFIAWRKATGLNPKTSLTFNIFHSDPRVTSPDEYRLDLCVSTDQPIRTNEEHIEAGMIPGGRCAVLKVVGNTDDLEPAALYLYRDCYRPVARKRGISPCIASASPSFRKHLNMRRWQSSSCP